LGIRDQGLGTELLDEGDQKRLLDLARRALEARVRGTSPPAVGSTGVLALRRGAFVTIHRRGSLRGCLGRLTLDTPLGQTIVHLAGVVADSDPRFAPVAPGELAELDIEISVLTPEREITAIEEIEVGRHGLIVEDGRHRGLLLPQVASEHGWSRETFLDQTCLKAGLPAKAWKKGARILVFEAQVFGEDQSGGTTAI
jgi:AmmeMemoRadiSam system protein A